MRIYTAQGLQKLQEFSSFAAPTALVGLAVQPGTSLLSMRADAAPALDQSIAPTWTGQHQFNQAIVATFGSVTAGRHSITVECHEPGIQMTHTSAGVDARKWRQIVSGNSFYAGVMNDSGSSAVHYMIVNRPATGELQPVVTFPRQATGCFLVGLSTAVEPTASLGVMQVSGGAAQRAAIFHGTNSGMPIVDIWTQLAPTNCTFINFNNGVSRTAVGNISFNSGDSQVKYNATCDARLKENIQDAADVGALFDALRVRAFDWKGSAAHVDCGFVAQELVEVLPFAVTVGDDGEEVETPWSVDKSTLVPYLVKELQSVRARLAALEGA